MKKALWVASFGSGAQDRLLDHCSEAGVDLVCIRTTSSYLPNAIDAFHQRGIKVYGWRWPAVDPGPHSAPHYFAGKEADYVADTLIPANIDGYIVDPESDGPGVDDWNDVQHADLAASFCQRIRAAAPAGFHFGVTSGCEYPRNHANIPWKQFVDASDALYPQAYWRDDSGWVHGGTPASSYQRAMRAWAPIAQGKPIIAMAGELALALPQEIRAFGDLVRDRQLTAHFYSDSADTAPAVLKAISSL